MTLYLGLSQWYYANSTISWSKIPCNGTIHVFHALACNGSKFQRSYASMLTPYTHMFTCSFACSLKKFSRFHHT